MRMRIEYFFIYILFIAFPLLIMAFTTFDRIVLYEYRHHRDIWNHDGNPNGFFWVPLESMFFWGFPSLKSIWSRNRLLSCLLFSTPFWVKESKSINTKLWILRTCTLIGYLSAIIFLILLYTEYKY
jgi:hypothetical protein